MSVFPEPGRRAGHIILDVVSAYDTAGGPQNAPTMQLAMEAIGNSGAVEITEDESNVSVDVSNVAMPAVILINWLLENHVPPSQRDLAIAEMREYLDS